MKQNTCCSNIQLFSDDTVLTVSKDIIDSDFFIDGWHFTILTDDETVFICKISEDRRGIQIVHSRDKSNFAEYFRNRLGVASGAFVTKEDLERYGRTDVVFYKLDDEHYYMDFSVR